MRRYAAEECNAQTCPIDCIGSFSPWGECDAPCGGGHRNRTYFVLSPEQSGGEACERKHEETDTEVCNKGKTCEVDCVGEWSRFSKCIAEDVDNVGRLCGPGLKTRKYTVTKHPRFGGKSCDAKHGQTHRRGWHIILQSRWHHFSPRYFAVKEHIQLMTASMFHVTNLTPGSECNPALRAECTERACPRDCAGVWAEWSACDAECGGGMQKRVFRIKSSAEAGGADCEAEVGLCTSLIQFTHSLKAPGFSPWSL